MRPLPQSINQAHFQSVGAFNIGLAASPFTGSASDNVLLWAAANQVVTGPPAWTQIANSATLGTTVTLFKKGVYEVSLMLTQVASITGLVVGISQDYTGAQDSAIVWTAANGARLVSGLSTTPAATQINIPLTCRVLVTPEQEAAGSVIRFHAGLSPTDPPTAGLVQAAGAYVITWLGENNI